MTPKAQNELWAQGKIDLTNCDREPIHIPGLVQSHGVLLVLREPELTIVQVSANTAGHFGCAPEELLNQSLEKLLGAEPTAALRAQIADKNLEAAMHYLPAISMGVHGKKFERVIHRYRGALLLECEAAPAENLADSNREFNLYAALKNSVAALRETASVSEFCQAAAAHVRAFTGFDRVMVYQFQEDESGAVVGEAMRDGLESYFGLHYPAADIPQQARALYLKNLLRFKVDVDDVPVPLVPHNNPLDGEPLDMSYCATRSMSPIHVEYLKNMGVAASMSISIIRGGRLWGLFACHHYAPKYISHPQRMACEFLAHLLALEMAGKEDLENRDYVERLQAGHTRFVSQMAHDDDYRDVLREDKTFETWLEGAGVALCFTDGIKLSGSTPGEAAVKTLTTWLAENVEENVYATHHLAGAFAPAAAYQAAGSGLLALNLSRQNAEYILWFRPEETQTVNWAGNPHKAVVAAGEHGERLTPRKSFALWRETVAGHSLRWQACEIEAARNLRRALLEIIVRRADELRRLNVELERSNNELDSFAYVASHDLKEPLRGIHNYSQFLLEDYDAKLDEEGVRKLQTLARLSQRMEQLTDSLLYYSRVGRLELRIEPVDLNEILADAREALQTRIAETQTEVRAACALPVVNGDRVRLTELFTNLISNAIKYNDKPQRRAEIGYLTNTEISLTAQIVSGAAATDEADAPHIVFYVRDNGIGIREQHFDSVFRIFKRLHGREEYGGGSGAGLTIARKIVERHGGRLWLESALGVGSTFYFTLPPGQDGKIDRTD